MLNKHVQRRHLLAGALAATVVPATGTGVAFAGSRSGGAQLAYVGSRTTAARDARGAGITVWRVSSSGSDWELLQTVTADDGTGRPGIPANPSFLTFSWDGSRAYCVHGDLALASSFAVDPSTGKLTHLNTVGTGHENPVHLSVSPDGKWLVVANFAVPGDLCAISIRSDGQLGTVSSRLSLPGQTGRTRGLQDGPNPHHVPWDPTGKWILVPDRGQDAIHRVQLDSSTGVLRLVGSTPTRPGDGPRHLVFHPDGSHAYVVNEISCSVTTYRWDAASGALTPLHALRTAPPTDLRNMTGAEISIHPSGRHVYSSNRSGTGGASTAGPGDDSVTVLELGRKDYLPTVAGVYSTRGLRPRFIGTDSEGAVLYAANELSDSIAAFELGQDGAVRREAGIIARTGSPVCILFRAAPAD
ncbi:lactonase family protein [Arthrobacter sp. NPDC058097]|uniref:lactonase family protein n=1 Tax=Arthrobacter sp. NPDC058097 TaxID=3346340 RepID=UPI0036DD5C3C